MISIAQVSLSMIVRNEEQNLPACLGQVAGLVDEIVVVDTGSTDRTREVAAGFGKVIGCSSFHRWIVLPAARNESLRHCTGNWILWLDADDRLDEANRAKLKRLLKGLGTENAAYVMQCLCLPCPGETPRLSSIRGCSSIMPIALAIPGARASLAGTATAGR